MTPDPTIRQCKRRRCYQVESDTSRLRKTIRPAPSNRSIWLRSPRELLTHPARSRVPRRHQPLATPGACHRTPHSKPLRCTALKRLLLHASRGAAQTPTPTKKKRSEKPRKIRGTQTSSARGREWPTSHGIAAPAREILRTISREAPPAISRPQIQRGGRRPYTEAAQRVCYSLSLSPFSFLGDLISLISAA